jgi:hypothetical protein
MFSPPAFVSRALAKPEALDDLRSPVYGKYPYGIKRCADDTWSSTVRFLPSICPSVRAQRLRAPDTYGRRSYWGISIWIPVIKSLRYFH